MTEAELAANRPRYLTSLAKREPLAFSLDDRHGRHRVVTLEPPTSPAVAAEQSPVGFADLVFEARIGAYLKSTEEWAPADQAPPAERHFIRKKRRARVFEARPDGA